MVCETCSDPTARDIRHVSIGGGLKLYQCYQCRKQFNTGDVKDEDTKLRSSHGGGKSGDGAIDDVWVRQK